MRWKHKTACAFLTTNDYLQPLLSTFRPYHRVKRCSPGKQLSNGTDRDANRWRSCLMTAATSWLPYTNFNEWWQNRCHSTAAGLLNNAWLGDMAEKSIINEINHETASRVECGKRGHAKQPVEVGRQSKPENVTESATTFYKVISDTWSPFQSCSPWNSAFF